MGMMNTPPDSVEKAQSNACDTSSAKEKDYSKAPTNKKRRYDYNQNSDAESESTVISDDDEQHVNDNVSLKEVGYACQHTGTTLIERIAKDIAHEEDGLNKECVDEDKRSRRLAMNRASARLRRKRKRKLLEDLQKSIDDLTTENDELRQTNAKIRSEIEELSSFLSSYQNATKGSNAAEAAGILNASAAYHQRKQQILALLQAGSMQSIAMQPAVLAALSTITSPILPASGQIGEGLSVNEYLQKLLLAGLSPPQSL